MKTVIWASTFAAFVFMLSAGCSTTPESRFQQEQLTSESELAAKKALQIDPGLKYFFDSAVGYAVFPSIGKGAVGIGGAFGRGELFEGGKLAGYCTLTQGSIGLALGGQSYTEFIFFEDRTALSHFKYNDFAFAAQVSAVALKSGVSANARYADGVAVFTLDEAGLMGEAAIGGQKFNYEPKR